jgi:hypothetical protein
VHIPQNRGLLVSITSPLDKRSTEWLSTSGRRVPGYLGARETLGHFPSIKVVCLHLPGRSGAQVEDPFPETRANG